MLETYAIAYLASLPVAANEKVLKMFLFISDKEANKLEHIP